MAFRDGALKSTWFLRHHFARNGPLGLIDRSGWSSLRSLNSCCHWLSEALLLDCWGSRSPAWRIRFDRFLWRTWWMAETPGWADTLGSDWTLPLDPRTRACWTTLGNQYYPVARVVLQHFHHLPKMAAGGKAYGSRSSQERLSMCPAHAWGTWTRDTNCGSLL